MSPLPVVAMVASDLDGVLAIERATFPAPWNREHFLHELSENLFAYNRVIRAPEGQVVAYANAWLIGEELRINNIAVLGAARRQGHGEALMRDLLRRGRLGRCEAGFLEVRPTNTSAIGLYEKLGFRGVGFRRAYYTNPREDALIMRRRLGRSFSVTHLATSRRRVVV